MGVREEKAVKVVDVENIGQWKRSVSNVKSGKDYSEIIHTANIKSIWSWKNISTQRSNILAQRARNIYFTPSTPFGFLVHCHLFGK